MSIIGGWFEVRLLKPQKIRAKRRGPNGEMPGFGVTLDCLQIPKLIIVSIHKLTVLRVSKV